MNIIYLSSSCSEEKFNYLGQKGITQKMPQAQKYHRLLLEGIRKNIDGLLVAISVFPVNRSWSKQSVFTREEESVSGIRYIYIRFVNFPVLKQLSVVNNAKKEIKQAYTCSGKTVIICDILNQSLAKAARQMGRKMNIPVLGIVTDVPGHTSGARRKSYSFLKRKINELAEKICKRDMVKYDAYLLLTDAMNDVVNLNKKPYIVLEGHSDVQMVEQKNVLENKYSPKVLMYAGGIHKEFGIAELVEAFIAGSFSGWELHIYGDGNYQTELRLIASIHKEVKYFGAVPNRKIVEQQLKATLLVNPRLTAAEYVKYSFPSKILECMVSGTPLLTTQLPGMPKEYNEYVYVFDEETKEGFCRTIKRVLSKEAKELHDFGIRAKKFAINEKNNVCQAEKLCQFLEEL